MSTNTVTSTNEEPILEAVHLRKEFPLRKVNLFGPSRAVHAVEDASLALRPGIATALVGESGSGKTTVARLLASLYPLSERGGQNQGGGCPTGVPSPCADGLSGPFLVVELGAYSALSSEPSFAYLWACA